MALVEKLVNIGPGIQIEVVLTNLKTSRKGRIAMPYTVEDFKRDQANEPVPEFMVEEVLQKFSLVQLLHYRGLDNIDAD